MIAVDLPGHAGSATAPRGTSMGDFAAVAAAVLEAEVERPGARRRPLLRRARRAAARASRPELVRGLLLVSPAGIRTTTRVDAVARPGLDDGAPGPLGRAVCATATPAVSGIGGRSSARGSSRMRARSRERATHGLLGAQREHTDTKTAARAMNRRRSAPRPRRGRVPGRRPLGRARPAVAARRRLRVHAPARRQAACRRRLRPPRDRREAGGLPGRARGARRMTSPVRVIDRAVIG